MTTVLMSLVLSAGSVGSPPVSPIEVKGPDFRSPYHLVSPANADGAGRVTVTGGEVPVVEHLSQATGRLYEPAFAVDEVLRGDAVRYEPQAGDLVLFVSDNPIWQLLFAFALTGEPYHAGIVVRTAEGSHAVLEAGPPDVDPRIRLVPVAERFPEDSGRVYVRRRAIPLTPEESNALTCFAVRQKGKPYALLRFLLQGTPIRCRGPLRTKYIGKCRGECFSYFCSELVMESLVAACLFDEETARPRATTPQDLFYDESDNSYINKTLKLCPMWGPPQRWQGDCCSR